MSAPANNGLQRMAQYATAEAQTFGRRSAHS